MRSATYLIICSLLAMVALSGCTAGGRAYSRGEEFEAQGRYEEAMYSYAEAFRNDPATGDYRMRFFKAREKAAEARYRQGTRLFEQGDFGGALVEFRAGLGIDPTQGRFGQLVETSKRLKDAQDAYQEGLDFEKANKFKDANRLYARAVELNPDNGEYRAAQARVLGKRRSKLEGYELSLKSTKPITLKFKEARIKDVFNIVTQLSGINFIFDETVKDQPVTVYLENATFQQTLDLLTNMFKLGRKVANESTVIIYPRTPEKAKQYEDMTVRTFNLTHLEAKKAINLVRTLLQVRKIYVNEESNSIVVRDTADVVQVVEKILDASDVPDAEVILDVEVLEIGDSDGKNVGLLLSPYNVQMGAFNSDGNLMASTLSSASDSGTTNSATDQLIKMFSAGGYGAYVTVPTATFNFAKTLAKSEVLSNPKLRVKNREKAKFNVGKRIPITTTNTTNSTVSVNVQYIDVGVKVNAEPTIQANNEIVIKLALEVSQDTDKQTVGSEDSATTVVTIATRNLETVLSLKDGETSVIGGLLERNNSDSKNKIFLLSDIPVLGELLTNTNTSNRKAELMLAITPRLVRGVTVPPRNLASFLSGKEDDPALGRSLASFETEPEFADAPKPAAPRPAPRPQPPQQQGRQHTTPGAQPGNVTGSAPPAPAQPPTTVQPATAVQPPVAAPPTAAPQPVLPMQPVQPTQPTATPQPASSPAVVAPAAAVPAQRSMLQIVAPVSVGIGQQFTLDVKAASVSNLVSAPFAITYDPLYVEFVSAGEGELLRSGGAATTFGSAVNAAGGSVSINLALPQGAPGVSGMGNLASLVFRAKQKGSASFGFRDVAFSAAGGAPLTVLPFSAAIDIR